MTQYAGRTLNNNSMSQQHTNVNSPHGRDEARNGSTSEPVWGLNKDKDEGPIAESVEAQELPDGKCGKAGKPRMQRQCGRNWYRKCLALCAAAESHGSQEGASMVAAALREATYAENLENRWIVKAESRELQGDEVAKTGRHLKSPLLIGRGPQYLLLSLPGASSPAQTVPQNPAQSPEHTWKILYGGLLRIHGGLGVSRLQKDVVGTGLRFEPNEVVRIQSMKDSELYVGKKSLLCKLSK